MSGTNKLPPAIKATAQAQNIYRLFAGKVFRVPNYQRNYAWMEKNLKDFWDDIRESLLANREHYWGTITLRAHRRILVP